MGSVKVVSIVRGPTSDFQSIYKVIQYRNSLIGLGDTGTELLRWFLREAMWCPTVYTVPSAYVGVWRQGLTGRQVIGRSHGMSALSLNTWSLSLPLSLSEDQWLFQLLSVMFSQKL